MNWFNNFLSEHFDWKKPYEEYDAGQLLSTKKDTFNLFVEDTSFRIYSPLPQEDVKVEWMIWDSTKLRVIANGYCRTMEEGRMQCQNAYLKLIGKQDKKQSNTISNHN